MGRKKDTSNGLFVQIGDRPLVKRSFMIDPEHEEKLRSLQEDGETLSDKIREAIAYYLQNQKR